MSNKYQQEIEEILKQAEGVLPKDRPKPMPSVGESGSAGWWCYKNHQETLRLALRGTYAV